MNCSDWIGKVVEAYLDRNEVRGCMPFGTPRRVRGVCIAATPVGPDRGIRDCQLEIRGQTGRTATVRIVANYVQPVRPPDPKPQPKPPRRRKKR